MPWEYISIDISDSITELISSRLKEYTKKGWEIENITYVESKEVDKEAINFWKCTLKREKSDDEG